MLAEVENHIRKKIKDGNKALKAYFPDRRLGSVPQLLAMYPNLFTESNGTVCAPCLVAEPNSDPELTVFPQLDNLPMRAPPYDRNGWRVVGVTSDLIAAVCRQIGRVLVVMHGDRLVHKEVPEPYDSSKP